MSTRNIARDLPVTEDTDFNVGDEYIRYKLRVVRKKSVHVGKHKNLVSSEQKTG